MKKTVSTAAALSTAIVIALGGIALSGQAASAESLPIEQEAAVAPSATAPVVEAVEEPQGIVGDAEQSVPGVDHLVEPAVEPTVEPVDGLGPTGDELPAVTDPTTVVPPVAADVVARAAAFSVASPQQGAAYPTLGYELVIDTTEALISYELFDSAGESLGGEFEVQGPRVSRFVHLDDDAPADQSVTVVVQDERGAVIGSETRSFRVEVPTSPAVAISSPRQGEVLRTPSTTWPGGGSFVLEGTAVAGSWLHYSYEALSAQTGWGSDYDAPVVRSDGTWAIADGLPYGSWRATVQQYVGVGDPALGGEAQPSLSRLSAPVTVEFTLAAPVVTAAPTEPAAVPAAVPITVRPAVVGSTPVVAAHRFDLAFTGPSETAPWAGLTGMVLVGLGAATVLVTRRRASRG